MATNHQCHCLPTPSSTTTTTCYCTMCYTTTHHPQPIHSLPSHHHYNPHQQTPPQTHHYPPQTHHFFQETPPPTNPTISSLIHRIAALESTLRRHKHSPQSSSLRDAAARTIQTHFRAFLVRRSITLRHLKHLAYIKSALNHLKSSSSVSNKTHFDSHTLYRESMNLLIKLESLQGSDPMIRDGKRSISRELIRFMELIDGMCAERQVIAVKNVRFGTNSKNRVSGGNLKNLRKFVNKGDERLVFECKSEPKVKKSVRFDDGGNVYRLFKSNPKQGSNDEEVEEIGVSSKETEVEEEEDDESLEMSENEMDARKNLRTRIHRTSEKNQPDEDDDDDDEDDSFVFSAPLPVKMEY